MMLLVQTGSQGDAGLGSCLMGCRIRGRVAVIEASQFPSLSVASWPLEPVLSGNSAQPSFCRHVSNAHSSGAPSDMFFPPIEMGPRNEKPSRFPYIAMLKSW